MTRNPRDLLFLWMARRHYASALNRCVQCKLDVPTAAPSPSRKGKRLGGKTARAALPRSASHQPGRPLPRANAGAAENNRWPLDQDSSSLRSF